jgi:hypothetical protein
MGHVMCVEVPEKPGKPIGARGALHGELDLSSGKVLSVTKADSGSDFDVCRALWVGTGGNVRVLTEDGDDVIFKNVPDGVMLPVRCTRVFATNTTATDLLALR